MNKKVVGIIVAFVVLVDSPVLQEFQVPAVLRVVLLVEQPVHPELRVHPFHRMQTHKGTMPYKII